MKKMKKRMKACAFIRTLFGGTAFQLFLFGALVYESSWKLSVLLMLFAITFVIIADEVEKQETLLKKKMQLRIRENSKLLKA